MGENDFIMCFVLFCWLGFMRISVWEASGANGTKRSEGLAAVLIRDDNVWVSSDPFAYIWLFMLMSNATRAIAFVFNGFGSLQYVKQAS